MVLPRRPHNQACCLLWPFLLQCRAQPGWFLLDNSTDPLSCLMSKNRIIVFCADVYMCRPLDPPSSTQGAYQRFLALKCSVLWYINVSPTDFLWSLKSGADFCVFSITCIGETGCVKVGPQSQRRQCPHENIRPVLYHLLPAPGFSGCWSRERRMAEVGVELPVGMDWPKWSPPLDQEV